MHFWTEQPVLFVEQDNISKIDPRKPENLFGMWSVFSKASGIMENGKRLENMSWRLWQQQTLCPKNKRKARPSTTASSRPQIESPSNSHDSIPALSSSVGSSCSSHSDKESHRAASNSEPTRAIIDGDVTSADLQNLLLSIKEKQELTGPLSSPPSSPSKDSEPQLVTVQETAPTPRTSSPRPTTVESSASTIESVQTDTIYLSPTNASETSVESGSESSSHSVVRGFKPGGISTYRSQSQLAQSPTPILKPSTEEPKALVPRTKGGLFQLGGSSGEEDSSMAENMSNRSRGSSLRTVQEGSPSGPRKQTTFVDQVTEIAPKTKFIFADDEDTAAIESDSDEEALEDEDEDGEEEEVSESAIDDDDAWEDEGEPEEPQRQLTFPRVESKPDLVSRRSLLTDNLHQSQRAAAMQSAASRSSPMLRRSRTSTPNGPSMPASPTEESPMKFADNTSAATQGLGGKSRPIVMESHSNMHPPQPPMSPRAARRNMVSQELGVSLRKHMLNERQYKNIYSNNNTMRRAHTSTDVRKLDTTQSQPLTESNEQGSVYPMSKDTKTAPWNNEYFDHDPSDYHQKGW